MTNLNQLIQQAQKLSAERRAIEDEKAVALLNARTKREQDVAQLFSKRLDLEWDANRFDCDEETENGTYLITLLIDTNVADWQDNGCDGARFVSKKVEKVQDQIILAANDWFSYNGHRGHHFDGLTEALAYAAEGYGLPEPESVIRLKRLVNLFRELCATSATNFPELSIQFSVHQADAGIIQAAQNLKFEKSFFGKGKGGSWKICDDALDHSHSLVVFDDSITE